MMATACVRLPEAQPSGQGNRHRHHRPDKPGALHSAYDGIVRFELIAERLYTLHDELSLFLVLLTEEHITSGFGAILPHKRQSLLLYGCSALGSSREGHDGTARLRWHKFLRLLKSLSPGSGALLVAFF